MTCNIILFEGDLIRSKSAKIPIINKIYKEIRSKLSFLNKS